MYSLYMILRHQHKATSLALLPNRRVRIASVKRRMGKADCTQRRSGRLSGMMRFCAWRKIESGLVTVSPPHQAILLALTSLAVLQADAILIRHFSHLSQSLLVPLNRYFATLHPHARPGDKPIPSLPFSNEDFVQSIKTYDTPLKFRRPRMPGSSSAAPHAAISLYHRFASSPNFAEWLRIRLIDSDEALRSRYLSNLETMNLSEWAKGRNGREVNGLLRQVEAEISTLVSALTMLAYFMSKCVRLRLCRKKKHGLSAVGH